jgi:hypothetical protein
VTIWLDGQLIIDDDRVPFNIRADGTGQGRGIGSLDFTVQLTAKDPDQITPEANIWYDSLIISAQPIAMYEP